VENEDVVGRLAAERRRTVRFLAAALVTGAVASVPMALAWIGLADPPKVEVTDQGAFLGEFELGQLVDQPAWLIVVGLVAGLGLGFAAAALAPRHPVTAVVGVLLCTTTASVLAGWLGHHVFGPNREEQLASAQVGDVVQVEVTAGTRVAYLGGPVGGLAGALGAFALVWPREKVAESWPEHPLNVPNPTPGSSTV
jgi:hypothetical protein